MSARPSRKSLLHVGLTSALLAACVATPDDVARLSGDQALVQRSEQGLVEATVKLDNSELVRGTNDFTVQLRGNRGSAIPDLVRVNASMASHGHRSSAATIVTDGETFRAVGLDLFMSGLWQVELGVELDSSSDVVEFAVDVP